MPLVRRGLPLNPLDGLFLEMISARDMSRPADIFFFFYLTGLFISRSRCMNVKDNTLLLKECLRRVKVEALRRLKIYGDRIKTEECFFVSSGPVYVCNPPEFDQPIKIVY